jgi:Gpi18-like mannosyltransferase
VSFLRHWSFTSPDGLGRRNWAELATVTVFSAVAVALIVWRVDLKTVGTAAFADPGWDRHLYREMARRDLFDFKLAPYCWRILVPLLAKLQPWSEQAGFLTVTGFALVATGPATYLLVRSAGGSRASAAAMVAAFYSLGWASRFPMSDFWVPDATSMLLTTVIMWLVISKRWAAAAVVMALGVLAKESVLFVAPLVLTA